MTNNSRTDIPLGCLFDAMSASESRWDTSGVFEVIRSEVDQPLSLRLVSSEFFRKSIDCVPYGHHAGVEFHGDTSGLRAFLEAHSRPWQVFLHSRVG